MQNSLVCVHVDGDTVSRWSLSTCISKQQTMHQEATSCLNMHVNTSALYYPLPTASCTTQDTDGFRMA